MDDLISRQAAIDEIKALYEWHEVVTEDRAIDHFKRLPSAQSERMKLVQKAVNTIMNTSRSNSVKDKCFRNAARLVQNAIDGEPQDFELIPDEPERKKGRWINHGQYADFFPHCEYRCSVCDHPYLEIEIAYDFCPNCGADMRGGDDALN